MQKPTHVLTTSHPDEVSGCTILSDGTKVYWTEGRSSYMTVIGPDGARSEVPAGRQSPLVDLLNEISETGYEPLRPMTQPEVFEYERTRQQHTGWYGDSRSQG